MLTCKTSTGGRNRKCSPAKRLRVGETGSAHLQNVYWWEKPEVLTCKISTGGRNRRCSPAKCLLVGETGSAHLQNVYGWDKPEVLTCKMSTGGTNQTRSPAKWPRRGQTRNAHLQTVDRVVKAQVQGPVSQLFSDGDAGVALETPVPVVGHAHVDVTRRQNQRQCQKRQAPGQRDKEVHGTHAAGDREVTTRMRQRSSTVTPPPGVSSYYPLQCLHWWIWSCIHLKRSFQS